MLKVFDKEKEVCIVLNENERIKIMSSNEGSENILIENKKGTLIVKNQKFKKHRNVIGVFALLILSIFLITGCGNREETTKDDNKLTSGKYIYDLITSIQSEYYNPKSVMVTNASYCGVISHQGNVYEFAYIKTSAQNKAGGYSTQEFFINMEDNVLHKNDVKYDIIYNYNYCKNNPGEFFEIEQSEIKKINNALEDNY